MCELSSRLSKKINLRIIKLSETMERFSNAGGPESSLPAQSSDPYSQGIWQQHSVILAL